MANKKETSASKEEKRLAAYKQHKPEQLSLFEMLAPKDKKYSNTMELYDFIPKYVWGKVTRINDKFLDTIEREFECRQVRYKVKIRPASIEDRKGNERYFFAGKREEMVEEALRKMIVNGSGVYLDNDLGIVFKVYQLKKELKRTGHTYSEEEIKDSIRILNDMKLTLITEDGKETGFHPIETYGFVNENGEERTFVKFSPLITNILKTGKYRLFDYDQVMKYKSAIARQLHKRFSHHHVSASITRPYQIKLSTIIRDFGLTKYNSLSHNLRDVETALKEMQESRVILSYKIDKILDTARKNKIVDAKITLIPDMKLEKDIIRANEKQKTARQLFESDEPENG